MNQSARKLSFLQLFEVLQQEYIMCQIRYAIYPEKVINKEGKETYPREYWKATAHMKKERILDISKRNSLMNIFDDSYVKEMECRKILPEIGYPKFVYKDASQQFLQEKWDLHNYYSKGAEVRVLNHQGKMITGNIKRVDFSKKQAEISHGTEVNFYDFDVITRIIKI